MDIKGYVQKIAVRHASGIAREHSYRGDLQQLLETELPNVFVTNEPARIACGAPDYILTGKANNIDVGYIEAKDIGKSLDDKAFKEQLDRYRKSLENLILTDYLSFRLYRSGEFVTEVSIAELSRSKKISPLISNFAHFKTFIKEFGSHQGQTLTSPSMLATMMASKAKLLAEIIESAILSDIDNKENTSLREQLGAFQSILIHDLDAKGFSDIYAQTIAYGMFAARVQDKSSSHFSRQHAAQLIPQTNPFLRKLFQYVSGFDIDSRIEWIVNSLAELFRATDMNEVLKRFSKGKGKSDPLIHFYETFLSEYDVKLRKARGVWYTPQPVVEFIVRSVDDVLKCKSRFNIEAGLSDESKIKVKVDAQSLDKKSQKRHQLEKQIHRVQILDPAVGTGTFLAEVVSHVASGLSDQSGIWSKYVEDHLIPRLNGFEILMASYAVAHLKIDLMLRETNYKPIAPERLRIYLTNSLEEDHPDTGTLFASWLSTEANEANHIKRDTPVMVVLGNPPYSRHSANKGEWLSTLLADYKKEPNSHQRLRERNSKWLNDDYVKFFRYAQYYIDKSGYGVVAFITNHGFIDNPTFRGMRWSLLNSFDEIFILDLHGNSNVSEIVPPGLQNDNVFDIKQGVAITVALRTGRIKKGQLASVRHCDVYGDREEKYAFLESAKILSMQFAEVSLRAPFYFFRNKEYVNQKQYMSWPSLSDIYKSFSTGYYTSCDDIIIGDNDKIVEQQLIDAEVDIDFDSSLMKDTLYRPFDRKKIYFDPDLMTRPRAKFVSRLGDENIIIITGKSSKSQNVDHFFISEVFSELKCGEYSKGSYMFPLYFSEAGQGDLIEQQTCNISDGVIRRYRLIAGKQVTPKRVHLYIYAVLQSDTYRSMFAENLKEDFARIPYPIDKTLFNAIADQGEVLLELHTMSKASSLKILTSYPEHGNNKVERPIGINDWKIDLGEHAGRIFINDGQYFGGIPVEAWEFSVGGYYPLQKWLKDRRGRELTYKDVIYYQKIVASIVQSIAVSQKIDSLLEPVLQETEWT